MKSVRVALVLASVLAGGGFACGPEQTYCYDQHKSCEQAKLDKAKEDRDKMNANGDGQAPSDGGATVID